jgi:hypothetical protein
MAASVEELGELHEAFNFAAGSTRNDGCGEHLGNAPHRLSHRRRHECVIRIRHNGRQGAIIVEEHDDPLVADDRSNIITPGQGAWVGRLHSMHAISSANRQSRLGQKDLFKLQSGNRAHVEHSFCIADGHQLLKNKGHVTLGPC